MRYRLKSFYVKDGYGIHNILPEYGIIPVIITGRMSEIVAYRARELGIRFLFQDVKDKVKIIQDVVSEMAISLDRVACIGDDLNDLAMMRLCGICGCPADAVPEVQKVCDYVCKNSGGHGAVREFIEWLIQAEKE